MVEKGGLVKNNKCYVIHNSQSCPQGKNQILCIKWTYSQSYPHYPQEGEVNDGGKSRIE